MNVLTLNQILKQIETFANAHHQVASYRFQNIWEINTSGVALFPIINVYTRGGTRRWFETEFGLDVWFLDRLNTDRSNEAEVISDQIQTAEDFIAYLRHPSLQQLGLILSDADEQPMEAVSEETPDNLAGVMISLSVSVKKPDDRCSIPATGLTPSTGAPSGVRIYNVQTGNTITIVSCGDNYPVYQFSVISGGNASTVFTDVIVATGS